MWEKTDLYKKKYHSSLRLSESSLIHILIINVI